MYRKAAKTKIYSSCASLVILCLIVTANPYLLNAHLYPEGDLSQLLRPASYQNGAGNPKKTLPFTTEPPPSLDLRGKPVEGAENKIIVTDKIVDVDSAGVSTLLGPGDVLEPEKSLIPRAARAGEIESIPLEFRGTPLGTVEGQFKLFNLVIQKQFENLPPFERDKFIEFNTDFFPDFDLQVDSPQKRLVEGVLEAIARRIVQCKRDVRFFRADIKIYIDFVSRKGDNTKNERIKSLFKEGLQIVKDHRLDEMLGSAPKGTALSDKIIITYEGDASKPEYPVLILKTEVISGEKIMAYPWHTAIDLSVSVLTIDRAVKNIQEEPAYPVIKELFQRLLKGEVDITDELLGKFLSNNLEAVINAAHQLILPPVQEIDLDVIDDIIRITIEAAKWA